MQLRLGFSARLALALTSLILLVPAGPPALAAPATLWVNNAHGPWIPPGTSCNQPGFARIQDAVLVANSGDRINVCPGTYVEQVVIPATKNNLTLRSTAIWQAVIKAPPDNPLDPVKAIVRVTGAQNTTLLAFTITGPGSGGCNSLRYGVRVDGGGSANILGNHITDIRDMLPPPTVSGCQNGVAILVGRNFEATTGSARIVGNLIERYQKNGPTVDNAGSNAYIAANRILGVGPTATIAQNGIQISRGATARVEQNFIANHIYTPTPLSTGFLGYRPGRVDVNNNTAARNDYSIFAELSSGPSSYSQNHVQASTADGFVLEGVSNHTVAENGTQQNGGPGIGIYNDVDASNLIVPSNNNRVSNNNVERNKDSGILLDFARSNAINGNHVRFNGTTGTADKTDGLRVNAASTLNTMQSNFMKYNVTHDCHDDSIGSGTSGTANFWINDRGDTQNKPGLCRRSEEDDPDDLAAQAQATQVALAAGWDADYAWYASDPLASEYTDWAATYATIDTQSVLQLLAELTDLRTRPLATAGE
jgi:parallel beta-helix repeat protein